MAEKRSWREFRVASLRCAVCGKRFHSPRGRATHWLACHTDSARAERNWNICMMFFEGGCSTREVAEHFHLPIASVQRIVANVAEHQHYYELDPELAEELFSSTVISLRRRA